MLTVGLRSAVIILLLLLSVSLKAQVLEKAFASSAHSEKLAPLSASIDDMLTSIKDRSASDDVRELRTIFKKAHRRFLKSYVQYSGVDELSAGRFDCLTATSLFAEILTRKGYSFEMIETNYHIFILVHTNQGEVVLETTDRFGGFVTDKERVRQMVASYRSNQLPSATASHYRYSFSLYQTVSAEQLAGLLYFNQAVKAFNGHRWLECSQKLDVSSGMIQSPRIHELANVLYHSVSVSNLDEDTKATIMTRWRGMAQMPIASR